MALSQISIPTDAARDAKAAELAKTAHLWHIVTLRKDHGSFKAGDRFRQTPNGYRVNAVVCECPDYKRGHVCKHIRAVVLFEAEAARFMAEVDAALGPPSKPRASYADVFGVCNARGCDEDRVRGGENYCDRHLLIDAF